MNERTNDPVDELAKGLAADHTLAKARGDVETETAEEPETTEEPEAELEPVFIGDFGKFDEVREYQQTDPDVDAVIPVGSLAVVNGNLVRMAPDGFKTVVNLLDEYGLDGHHSAQHEEEMRQLESVVMSAEFESGSILGDVVDLLVDLYKVQRIKWTDRSEQEKRDLLKHLESVSKTIIRKVVRVVTEGEEISVSGTLKSYKHSGAFDLAITAHSDEEAALQLFKMQGHEVIIMSADAERFLSGSASVEIEPDQASLFADGDEEKPEDDDLVEDELETEDEDLEEETEELEDDSDLAGDDDEPDAIAKANETASARKASFDTSAMSSSSEQRDDLPAADYVGPNEPENAQPGESWVNPERKNDSRPRYLHPNGNWNLSAPTEEALEAWRNAPVDESEPETETNDDDGFPDVD